MKKKDVLFEFPCQFPIKIMGSIDYDLEKIVTEIIKKHVEDEHIVEIKSRQSAQGNFTSVTVLFVAHSKKQLDTLYHKLSKHKAIKMVL